MDSRILAVFRSRLYLNQIEFDMRLPEKQFRHNAAGIMFLLLLPLLWGFSARSLHAGEVSSSPVFQTSDGSGAVEDREYSAWEHRIAQEVISTGQMLETDPRFDDVVSTLAQRGQSLLPDGSNVTQDWVRENLRDVLPAIKNKMTAAAINAATGVIAKGAGDMANGFAGAQVGLSGEYDIGQSQTYVYSQRSGRGKGSSCRKRYLCLESSGT